MKRFVKLKNMEGSGGSKMECLKIDFDLVSKKGDGILMVLNFNFSENLTQIKITDFRSSGYLIWSGSVMPWFLFFDRSDLSDHSVLTLGNCSSFLR